MAKARSGFYCEQRQIIPHAVYTYYSKENHSIFCLSTLTHSYSIVSHQYQRQPHAHTGKEPFSNHESTARPDGPCACICRVEIYITGRSRVEWMEDGDLRPESQKKIGNSSWGVQVGKEGWKSHPSPTVMSRPPGRSERQAESLALAKSSSY